MQSTLHNLPHTLHHLIGANLKGCVAWQTQQHMGKHRFFERLAFARKAGFRAFSKAATTSGEAKYALLERQLTGFTSESSTGALTSSIKQARDAVHLALKQQQYVGPQLKQFRKEAAQRWQVIEDRIATCSNSLWTSTAGQKLMAVGLPMLATELCARPWRTSNAHAHTRAPPDLPKLQTSYPLTSLADFMHAAVEELLTALRGLYLAVLFMPVMFTLPVALLSDWQRERWLELLRWTLERAGPAFIKWGQWAATRPDLFTPDLCHVLEKLHANAPEHSYSYTRAAIANSFGVPIEHVFSSFETQPVASGSIAQVYRASLSEAGAAGTGLPAGSVVAVKVRHPGVNLMMHRDFALMQRAAAVAGVLPGLRDLTLDESVRQFGAPLKEQLDLSREAQHLARFNHNFRLWTNLSFPVPIFPLVTADVLVESFEEGKSINAYVKNPGHHTRPLADLGMNCYLKMLLKDNFVHYDQHPGNVLVRFDNARTLLERLGQILRRERIPHLIMLDAGMAGSLTENEKDNLVQFFKAVSSRDGAELGKRILAFSPENQRCKDPNGFVSDMQQLFDGLSAEYIRKNTSEVMGQVMDRVRRYHVTLQGAVSTIVVTTMVLEGWSTKLNPDINIIDSLKELLPMKWTERISQTADRVITKQLLPGPV